VKAQEAAPKESTKFEQFNLRTESRTRSRKRQSLPSEVALKRALTFTFKANKMPDFSENFSGLKPQSPKKLTTFAPFNLSTFERGEDKQGKLDEQIEQERKDREQRASFRATPNKSGCTKNVTIPDRIKSDKQVTRAVGVTLASDRRSVKRGLFEQAIREKERFQQEEKAQLELERLQQEEEEVKKIRAASNFKATPIMKYRNNLGAVEERKLTVPVAPTFKTAERAALKQEEPMEL
jgi:hypothetical protein